jgi:hypothetical protein
MTEQPKPEPQAGAPYEGALNIALNKLTSEVLLFLLAYTILLIGMAVFGSGLAIELRTLLYVIPILGVVAYAWLQKRAIEKRKAGGNVIVESAVARKGAEVIGERGTGQGRSNTTVGSLYASNSRVIGRESGGVESQSVSATDAADVRYLVEIFQKLEEAGRDELMAKALEIQKRERRSHA